MVGRLHAEERVRKSLTSFRPEDIFGSVEVNGKGEIIGNYQPSGTYRIITPNGM